MLTLLRKRLDRARHFVGRLLCLIFGHPPVYNGCFGYMHCARCGELLGDTIGGAFQDERAVVVGHGCDTCRENYRGLKWHERLLIPRPFPKVK